MLIIDAEFSKAKMCGRVPLPVRCQPRFGAPISAVARVARITFKDLISHSFLMAMGQISGAKRIFPLSTEELRRVRHRRG
jgi:hypothetical protein